MHDAGAPTFDNILDDLEGILHTLDDANTLSYGNLQAKLTWKPCLHLINYIRFFERQGWVSYDRISDEVEVTGQGQVALGDPDAWAPSVREAFADYITPAEGGGQGLELGAPAYEDEELGSPTEMLSAEEIEAMDLTEMAVPLAEDTNEELQALEGGGEAFAPQDAGAFGGGGGYGDAYGAQDDGYEALGTLEEGTDPDMAAAPVSWDAPAGGSGRLEEPARAPEAGGFEPEPEPAPASREPSRAASEPGPALDRDRHEPPTTATVDTGRAEPAPNRHDVRTP